MSRPPASAESLAEAARARAASERHAAEARLMSNFDALYEAGGAQEGVRLIMLLSERLAERIRKDAARQVSIQTILGGLG